MGPSLAGVVLLALASERPSGDYVTLPLRRVTPEPAQEESAFPLGIRYALELEVSSDSLAARNVRMLFDTSASYTLLIERWENRSADEVLDYSPEMCSACEDCIGSHASTDCAPDKADACEATCEQSCEEPLPPDGEHVCTYTLGLGDGLGVSMRYVRPGAGTLQPLALECAGGCSPSRLRCDADGGDTCRDVLPSAVHAFYADPCGLYLQSGPSWPTRSLYDRRRFWRGLGGVIGGSFWPGWPDTSDESAMARTLWPHALRATSKSRLVYALDLSPSGDGSLVLGGDWSGARDLLWSESLARLSLSDDSADEDGETHECHMSTSPPPTLLAFDLRVCGSPLTTISSSWPVNISTGSSCLVLPGELFDPLMRWVPSECEVVRGAFERPQGRVCYLPKALERRVGELPALSFALSEGGPLLHVPLEALLLDKPNATNGRRAFCVHSAGYSSARGTTRGSVHAQPNATLQPLVFGAQVLAQFLTVIEMEGSLRRVGLRQRDGVWSSRDEDDHTELCAERAECDGDAQYDTVANSCRAPKCAIYFQQLDPETLRCGFSPTFRLVCILLVSLVAIADLATHELQRYLGKHLRAAPQPVTQAGVP